MSLKKYEAFVKVVELGSLTRAAELLGYTQSGVSHMIHALEEEMGFILLRRSRAGVALTESGARLLPAIRSILNANEQLCQIGSAIRGLEMGTVSVGAFSSVAVNWLPGMIRSFQVRYPNIEFKLLNGDYHDVEKWLSEGAADLGFLTLPTGLELETIPLVEDPLLVVLPAGHPLAEREQIAPEALAGEDFIGLLESSGHDIRRALDPYGIRPKIKFTTKDDYAILAMVEQGLGVSIMPRLLLAGVSRKRVVTRPLSSAVSRPIVLAAAPGGQLSPAAQSFSKHIVEWLMKQTEYEKQ